jgi:ABC-2 type transport system ATP-binding protein
VRSNGVPIRWGQAGWKERISYVRENPAFYGDLTVAATLRLASRLYRTWDEGFATNQLSRLGLAPDQHVKHLSKGSAVKLGIVTALAHRAEFLILDEPTSGLDPTARAEIHETLWNLRQEQAPLTLLFSSHVLDDVGQVADEVIVLRNGALVFRGAVRELATLEVFRLPDTADLAASELKKSPDARLVWRTDRCLRVAVPQGSVLAAALAKRPDVVEETTGMTLQALYERTALAC